MYVHCTKCKNKIANKHPPKKINKQTSSSSSSPSIRPCSPSQSSQFESQTCPCPTPCAYAADARVNVEVAKVYHSPPPLSQRKNSNTLHLTLKMVTSFLLSHINSPPCGMTYRAHQQYSTINNSTTTALDQTGSISFTLSPILSDRPNQFSRRAEQHSRVSTIRCLGPKRESWDHDTRHSEQVKSRQSGLHLPSCRNSLT